jgi:ferritin
MKEAVEGRRFTMSVKCQIDGDIFQEMAEKWLFTYVREFLIKKRAYETDQTGNLIEYFQWNDGRIFSGPVSAPQADVASKSESHAHTRRDAVQRVEDPSIS